MNSLRSRRIFKFSLAARLEVRELLQALLVGEMLFPSNCIWVVSPWITNFPIIDNSSGAFHSLKPEWGRGRIGLADVLSSLVKLGTRVVVATKPLDHNEQFIRRIEIAVQDAGLTERLHVTRKEELHLKGLLSDGFCLSGSMNFTFNGVELLDEVITFDVDASKVAEARLAFQSQYGGEVQ